jgi:hypothetical protein
MTIDEVQQVPGPDELYPAKSDEIRREQRRDRSEGERAADAVSKRLPLLPFGKAENQNSQHHRVVGAQQSFERDEQCDSEEIRELEHVRSG